MKKYTHDIGKMKQNRLMHFQIGLIIALGIALTVVNYSMDVYVNGDSMESIGVDDDIMITPPRTDDKKVTPPPVIEKVDPEKIIEDLIFDEEPEPEPQPKSQPTSTTKTKSLPAAITPTAPKKKKATPAPKPPVIIPPSPPKSNDDGGVVKIAEIMPVFKVPKNKNATEDEIKKHADAELVRFVMKRVKYPAIAKENGIEGSVVVRFVVEKNGEISKIEILRDPGFGLGDAVLNVVKKMPKWERVGRQNGRSVRVYFTMPVKFELPD